MSTPHTNPHEPDGSLTCRDVAGFLMMYIDKELPSDQAAEFERHLAACPSCVCYMASYQRAVELGKSLGADQQSALPAVPEGLVRAVLQARKNT